MSLKAFNERQEKRVSTFRTLLEQGESGESLRQKVRAAIARKRWKPSEKAMAVVDAEECIAEAIRRHYKPDTSPQDVR